MKTNILISACSAAALLLGSCSGNGGALDGTFQGVMPAADCPGINTVARFSPDGTYRIEREYLERRTGYAELGRYSLSGDMAVLISDEGDTTRFLVEKDAVRQLDMQGNVIEGPLSDYYMLQRCDDRRPMMYGQWTEPIPGSDDPSAVQGFVLNEDGTASSVNMATLLYKSWDRVGDLLFLSGESVGNGVTIAFTDTLLVTKCTADSLVLSRGGYQAEYTRAK